MVISSELLLKPGITVGIASLKHPMYLLFASVM